MADVDHSSFTFHHSTIFLILLIYVDDIFITINNTTVFSKLILDLNQKFRMKDLGLLNFFLGLEIYRHHNNFVISQKNMLLICLRK